MKKRDIYLSQLIEFKDKELIKVITGIRRCGKSSLLTLFEEYLINNGTNKEYIIRMNFESFEFDDIQNYKELYKYIRDKMKNDGTRHYLLLDEVQQVESWEKAINALIVDTDVDIYITGSNAYLLSSELSTLLSGRYVEIKMLPLSFKEYLDFNEIDSKNDLSDTFNSYLEYGSLPTVVDLLDKPNTIGSFLSGIYNTVLMKDVIQRNQIRDAALLDSVIRFLAGNIGNIVSTRKISNYLTSSGRKTTTETIDNYLNMLENSFIVYRVKRYDMKGKLFLKTLEKFYMVDMGLRNHLIGFKNSDFGNVLENIVFLELLRRGYEVAIGKVDDLEIDFIATGNNEKIYYQVSATIMDENTRDRELRPFKSISDNYPKLILTMDRLPYDDFNGIRHLNIIDFLLEGKFLDI